MGGSKSVLYIHEAKIQLQKVSSRLAVLILPRAFAREVPGSDLRGIYWHSTGFDFFATTNKNCGSVANRTFLKAQKAPAAARQIKYLETVQKMAWASLIHLKETFRN